ncbi:DNA polymerase delta subunit 3-like [Lecanosticta acicola]|uniref:DNA polymerase delta subunit 3 n=1 Tax=Lecanosticta acicola TaxID=111012 RepID=A0AAI8YXS8_9PEZI|nr:DNA polymerase delta subunit 3-like [Lecanosticta acicola]
MAQDYSEYLAVNVLNEQQYVSYRNLSRALKVHCNLAKQMLYDFHHKQNSKKPGSVHATYIITGTKRAVQQANGVQSQDDDEDAVMQSSPPLPSSSMPKPEEEPEQAVPVKSIMLVKEEHMEQARELFETITGMHIYSLQAKALGDVHVLTDCNRRVAADYASEDPLKEWKQYGTIQNPNVRRRTGKRPPPQPTTSATKPDAVKARITAAAAAKSSAAEVLSASKTSPKDTTPEPVKSATNKPTAAKKSESGLFKAFAKGAAKPKKAEPEKPSKPGAHAEDVPMTGFSDDEDDDGEDGGLPEELADVKAPSGKSKSDREAELKAMMEQEDEPMEDAAAPAEEELEAEEEVKHEEGAIDKVEPQEKQERKEHVTVENGRRRGRRRVMKKKTVKDEDGYIVTREEPAWESFSEDEPAPKKPKVQAPISNKPAPGGKKGGKPGQGNIMSFFKKG